MPVRERYIRSFDGTELYTTSEGNGPPVVLCDGLGCAGFIWRYVRPRLTSRYQVITWNYRGHGLSRAPKDLSDFSMSHIRQDLGAVMDAYNVPRAALVGHSMGVQVILEFALRHPERVQMLVPVCGSYGRPLDTLHGDGRISALFPLIEASLAHFPRLSNRAWRRVMMSRIAFAFASRFEVNAKLLQPPDFKPYFEHLAGMDPNVFLRSIHAAQSHSVEDYLTDVRAPTLVVTGERDTFTPMWLSLRMKQLIPGAELLVAPGASHIAPIEIPDLINTRIEKFLHRHHGHSS
jgi:pimeloyl-ACP methyl ester carboxylesterase